MTINVRISEQDYARLKKLAKASKRPIGTAASNLVRNGLGPEPWLIPMQPYTSSGTTSGFGWATGPGGER